MNITATKNEVKVKLFSEAIERSEYAKSKGASVQIIDGKIQYRILGYKATGTYVMRSNYREVLCMLHREDIKLIMSI